MQLQDNDYELIDGAGWFSTGGYSIRIYKDGENFVHISVYEDGKEYESEIDSIVIPPFETPEA